MISRFRTGFVRCLDDDDFDDVDDVDDGMTG